MPGQLHCHTQVQQQPGIVGYSTRKLAIDGDRILEFSRGHQLHPVLGLLDAGLGRKEDAIREGTHAVELLPISKDSINGTLLVENLAVIYAWTGETDRALETLSYLAGIPGSLSYGYISLRPEWDPLRNDPRLAKIIASLAPKN